MPLKTGAMLLPIKPESPRRMQRQRIIPIVFWNSFQASVADAHVVLEQNRARCIRMKSSHRNGHSNLWKTMISLTKKNKNKNRPVFLFRDVHCGVGKINPAQLLTPPSPLTPSPGCDNRNNDDVRWQRPRATQKFLFPNSSTKNKVALVQRERTLSKNTARLCRCDGAYLGPLTSSNSTVVSSSVNVLRHLAHAQNCRPYLLVCHHLLVRLTYFLSVSVTAMETDALLEAFGGIINRHFQ